MTRAPIFALALPLALAIAAPAQADPRLVEIPYDAARIVRIEGKPTVQASIMFADNEMIENVAIGDSAAWQVTPNKRANVLFVKPLAAKASTNMTVITNKRTYLFDLVAAPAAKPVYVLRFAYAPEPETKIPDEQLAADAPPQGVVDPLELNFAWAGSGAAALLPARSFDDGIATYLTWPEGHEVPAILVTNAEGTEGPVNFTVRGATVVIDGVPREIVLRSGKQAARLVNSGPERASAVPQTYSAPALASAKGTK